MDLGSFFYLRSTNGTMNVSSSASIYRGADMTTKGGVFYIYASNTVNFTDVGSLF
jgi:hypothetical protein